MFFLQINIFYLILNKKSVKLKKIWYQYSIIKIERQIFFDENL